MNRNDAIQYAKSGHLEKVHAGMAINHDIQADKNLWLSAAGCARVVSRDGKGDYGKTLGLADAMGRSVDTIENRAHAYWLFEDLCKLDGGDHRRFVFLIRRQPYIKLGHFSTLYDARITYKLSDGDVLSLLIDLYRAEGISTRKLQQLLVDKYGDVRDWTYYGQRAMKEIHKTLQHPDTPKDVRKTLQAAWEKLGDQS